MAAKPYRVQLSRKKGFRLPENTVSVARPSRWGNCYKVGMPAPWWMGFKTLTTIEECVEAHRHLCRTMDGKAMEIRTFLRGRNIACWCGPSDPCHGDTLLRIANSDTSA